MEPLVRELEKGARRPHLFTGEDELTDDVREVESWVGVYAELMKFCENALAEPGRTPNPALESWRTHFDERLSFWNGRRDQIRTA